MRVLSLQPFYGGSHQQFNDGWAKRSRFEWTTLSLPARHWKWRMRHASLYFSEEVSRRLRRGENWDVIFCSDMLSVAELRGLLPNATRDLPIVLYFHENQFEYPNRVNQDRDLHFSFTNFTSAVSADRIWFNSRFNFQSLMAGVESQARHWPDFVPHDAIQSLEQKISIQPPGLETPWKSLAEVRPPFGQREASDMPLHLLWAARWEHDKNPDDLLAGLVELRRRGVKFRISLIGESYREVPNSFDEIKNLFPAEIEYWGYQESRADYWRVLTEADVFISTANHEFFGIAAAEAIVAGLHPLLPDRLAYPELIQMFAAGDEASEFLFDGTATGLADRIEMLNEKQMSSMEIVSTVFASRLLERLNWQRRAGELDEALDDLF